MYTIAFDETINFEILKNQAQKDEPIMLAGIVYKDISTSVYKKNGNVTDPERERIVRYFKKVCKSAGTRFPQDLHSNGTNDFYVKKSKEEVRKTLGEFIKFGTYKGGDLLFTDGRNNIVESGGTALKREGFYQLVTLLKSSEMISGITDNSIQSDNVASNLYLNMAQEYLKKGIFYNLSITEDTPSVAFNIPSRKLKKVEVDSVENYNKYGYGTYLKPAEKDKADSKDIHYFKITDEGYYHALITELSNLREISVDSLFTKSIVYKSGQERKQAFLFLADSVCATLSYKNDKPYDQDIRKRMNRLNYPEKNLFFYYEGRNDYFDKAVQAYVDKDMLTALSELYDGKRWSSPDVKKYYRKKWYSVLEKKVLETLVSGTLEKTVDALDKYRYCDNLEQKKLLYMLETVEKAAANADIDNRYKFRLADIGISAYTHTGNPKMAEHYYFECMKYQDDIDSDDLQRAQIRYITTLNDLFAYERARDHALSLLGIDSRAYPAVVEKKKKLIIRVIDWLLGKGVEGKESESADLDRDYIISLMPEKVSRPSMYKALSSLGQTYAFMKDPMAEYCFVKLINDIQYAPDSSITKSFLLHWYIENGDEASYRRNAVDYFDGRADLNDQLLYLIKEGSKKREESPRFSLGYAMFVFIKAFYVFYKDDTENSVVAEKLIHIKDTINAIIPNGDRCMKNHPWEIIFKYAAMLASNTGGSNFSGIRAENKRNAKNAIGNQAEYIIKKVMEFGDIEILSQELTSDNKIRKYHNKINALWNELFAENVFPYRSASDITEKEKLYDLKQVFTYMYH